MVDFSETQELSCPVCEKPFTFRKSSPTEIELEGCCCTPPQKPAEIPLGSVVTDLGGLLVIRFPKEAIGLQMSSAQVSFPTLVAPRRMSRGGSCQ